MTLSLWHVHLAVLSQRAGAKGSGLRCQTWLIMRLKTLRGTRYLLGFDLNCPVGHSSMRICTEQSHGRHSSLTENFPHFQFLGKTEIYGA